MTIAPMEALAAPELPVGPEWQYEPKWDGFRCIASRSGDEIDLKSKSGQPLGRYFPDIVGALAGLGAKRFILDGELFIAVEGDLSFNELQLRLHPASSRVNMLAHRHPATYVVFDLLGDERGASWLDRPLRERRRRLEEFADKYFHSSDRLRLSPHTHDLRHARRFEPLAPKLVVEVQYDHFTGGRFRHGTRLLRWRPDKSPQQCTMKQVEHESRSPLGLIA